MPTENFAEKLTLYDLEHVIYLLHEIEARNIIFKGRNSQMEYLINSDFGIDKINTLLESMPKNKFSVR